MHASLKVISLLLSYPTAELQASVPDIRFAVNHDALINQTQRDALIELAEDIADMDLFDVQERYVWLFDRTRSLSLHLFEHVHGESRDRGQAMVGLMQLYEENGLEVDARELPDYLPLFLEYLSTRPTEEACGLLGQASHIAAALAERLHKRESVYASVFDVLVAISEQKPDPKKLQDILAQPEDDPSDLEALDQIWDEETVTFGGGDTQRVVGLEELRSELKVGTQRAKQSADADSRQEI